MTPVDTAKLHSAQLNGSMGGSQQSVQGTDQRRGQGSRLVEHNLNDLLSLRIHDEKPTDMKHIADHAQRAILPQWRRRSCQPGPGPDHHIVSQAAQKHYHLLGFKTLFAPLADALALLVAFERGLYPATPLVIEPDTGQQDRLWTVARLCLLPTQTQHLDVGQSRDQHPDTPLPILLATTDRNASDSTNILGGRLAHPAHLTSLHLRVIHPGL